MGRCGEMRDETTPNEPKQRRKWGYFVLHRRNRDCKSVLSFGMRVRRSIFLAQQCVCLGISDHELLLWIPRQASA